MIFSCIANRHFMTMKRFNEILSFPCKLLNVDSFRNRLQCEIQGKLSWVRSKEYRQELMQSFSSLDNVMILVNDIISCLVHFYERRLLELEVPSHSQIMSAVSVSSRDVQHVFKVLGFTFKTFVMFVEEHRLSTIEHIVYNRETVEAIDTPGIPEESVLKLVTFIDWHDDFLEEHNRVPEVQMDFNKTSWWNWICSIDEFSYLERLGLIAHENDTMEDGPYFLRYFFPHFSELELLRDWNQWM
jgi:hypothetical protein